MPSMTPVAAISGVPTQTPIEKFPLLCSDNDPLLCSDQLECTDAGPMGGAATSTGTMVAA